MAFIPFPDGALVQLAFYRGSETWTINLHAEKADYVPADMEALAVAGDALGGEIATMMSVQAFYKECRVVDLRTEDGGQQYNTDSAAAGSSVSDMLPVQAALVVSLYTAKRGRSYRGRVYLSGFAEDHWTDHAYDGTLCSAILGAFAQFDVDLNAAGWTWVVASYYHNGAPRTEAVGTTVGQVIIRKQTAGTQRRRSDRG